MKRERLSTDITRIQFDSMEEWLVNRKGIGGSDASAILGLNPYKTNQELWMEKKGQMSPVDISGKSYVKYGNDAEPLLRALFALDYPEYKVEYYDNNMLINKKYPWAHASLDGELIDSEGRRGILEIKIGRASCSESSLCSGKNGTIRYQTTITFRSFTTCWLRNMILSC